ncbi:MAG: HAMP domain-containing histidine kinase [Oscillospiraceae bacterium]|nr:HAMP domain-containing histidine kinase [Oscillospiraceae bacterium]
MKKSNSDKKLFKAFLINMLTSGKHTRESELNMSGSLIGYVLVNFISIFGGGILLIYTVYNILREMYDVAAVCAFMCLVVIVCMVLSRKNVPLKIISLIILVFYGMFCVWVVWIKQSQGVNFLFIYVYPLLAIMMLGMRLGVIFSTVLMLVVSLEMFIPGFSNYTYHINVSTRMLATYFLVFSTMITIELTRNAKDRLIEAQNVRLQEFKEKREQELLADNEMLDRMNRMKNEFLRDMSHDFKTPLTVISTSVMNAEDMLDFELDKEAMRETLRTAQNEIMRMARMVDSSMKYSSLQDNRQDMHPLDIVQLLYGGAETHRALLARNDNELFLDVPETLPQVCGNGDMLLHVLSNLLSNANRHTRNGRITVSAALDGDMLIITVRDSGAGVNPEIMPHIFERGVSEGGTGLGLAICKTTVETHGGTIRVESDQGKGAAVIFTLPVYKAE